MTTMVALIGGQPQSNFLPVLHHKPSDVVFVYTANTQAKYENLKITLEKPECHIYGIETDPYNIANTTATLNQWLTKMTKLSSQPMVFDLTGGTKSMAVAAYQVAAQYSAPVTYLQTERGQSSIDRYDWQDHKLCWQAREPVQQYLSLHDVLNLYLRQGKDDTRETVYEANRLTDPSNGEHLFERTIAQVLEDQDYEVLYNVRNRSSGIEIDLMIRYQNHIGIIETKTSVADTVTGHKSITGLKVVKQLNNAMRRLGGTYIRQFLVINGEALNDVQSTCDILHIPIICLLHYAEGAASLSQEDSEMLVTEIDRTMKMRIFKF